MIVESGAVEKPHLPGSGGLVTENPRSVPTTVVSRQS